MFIKTIYKSYTGAIWGIGICLVIVCLGCLRIINILKGGYLFFSSIPFLIWIQLEKLFSLRNDFLSACLFNILMFSYFGLLGQLIFLLKLKQKNIFYWSMIIILIILNMVAYYYSINFLNSLDKSLRNIFL